MWDTSHIDSSSGPLRTRVLDQLSGRRNRSRRVWANYSSDHLWRCVRVWRRRMNHELAELYGEPSILVVAKAGRICWLGHVMRMLDSFPTKKVFESDPQFDMRCMGAQRTRWLGQVKRDLSEIECLNGWEAAGSDWGRILEHDCWSVHVTAKCSIAPSRPTKESEWAL